MVKRVLVTGASGFVGSNITKFLVNEGYEVIAQASKNEQNIENLGCTVIYAPFYELDLDSLGKIDVLFHQAAIADTRITDRDKMIFVNTTSSLNLFKGLIERGCKNIVYASSTAVYGNSPPPYIEGKGENPLNVYGESKLLLDKAVLNLINVRKDVKIIGLRYCNVFGPGESHKGKMANMIYQLAIQMKTKNPKMFKYGEQKRDHIYVKDVVRANILAMNSKNSGVINCGTGNPVTFNQILDSLNQVLGLDRKAEYIDNPFELSYQNHTECDLTLTKKTIGFKPEFTLNTAIKDYFDSGELLKESTNISYS